MMPLQQEICYSFTVCLREIRAGPQQLNMKSCVLCRWKQSCLLAYCWLLLPVTISPVLLLLCSESHDSIFNYFSTLPIGCVQRDSTHVPKWSLFLFGYQRSETKDSEGLRCMYCQTVKMTSVKFSSCHLFGNANDFFGESTEEKALVIESQDCLWRSLLIVAITQWYYFK